ncbi:hypothetical protein [Adhaeretor mobilis]|uniref:Carboxypeptidase regulatory-like domain-containing protein n=1 Tax=Adhaeretor mobilis TaxID=1930276 RepID=A0A517MYD7_9BACT|nr:hypothetical protein [Adhaeretor mobilis]QDS99902.1 hypothetical protein HG15A2_32330 [Adhaeretor mobilis]
MSFQRKQSDGLALALMATLFTVGCGGYEATLSGTVTLDGQPLNVGRVNLAPTGEGKIASASIKPDGTYEVITTGESGMVPGQYGVSVRAYGPGKPDPNGGPPMPGKLLIPNRYGSGKTSGLSVDIQSGENTYDIALESGGDEPKGKSRGRR